MLFFPPLWQSTTILIGTWIIWRILRRLVRKDPLAILPGPPSDSWVTGNLMKVIDNDGWEDHQDLTASYGKAFRITGPFKENILFIYDTKALHHVVVKVGSLLSVTVPSFGVDGVKDGNMYEPTEDFSQLTRLIMGNAILGTLGEHHRNQRKMLTPVFSIAHMREMTPTFHDVVRKVRKTIVQQVSQGEKEIDMLSWMTRTALELIGQSGYGYSFDTLEPDAPPHPFYTSIKNLNRAAHNNAMVLARYFVLPYVYGLGSPGFQRAVVDLIPWKKLHELRDMTDVMHNTSIEIFEATRQAMEKGEPAGRATRIGAGKDIMSVLLKYNASASEKERLPDDELLAQISALTFAAMDTTSNSLSRILHLLSENPEAQEKLRDEIRAAQAAYGSEELDYDALNALPYLDAVCRETLRLYAPIPFLTREAQADTVLPLSHPVTSTDGKPLHEILVPKKTRIMMSLLHCNRDPDIWGVNAAEWKPERWLNPLPESVAQARVPGVYSNLMTFMGGGRSCLGFKFSQLEMKVVLCHLLPAIKFAPSGRMVKWQLNLLYQPTTEDAELTPTGDRKLQLPLNVSLAEPSSE